MLNFTVAAEDHHHHHHHHHHKNTYNAPIYDKDAGAF